MLQRMVRRIKDWFLLTFVDRAARCPQCGEVTQRTALLLPHIFVCSPCNFGFTKKDQK